MPLTAPARPPAFAVRAVLFDLDGTLADTAPDLGGALNRLRARAGLAPMPIAELARVASSGARGMIGHGLGRHPGDADYEALRLAFLDEYAGALTRDSRLFDGVAELLRALEARGLRWGIVTNKAMRFAEPVVQGLGLLPRAAVLIAGDTTPHAKPHPAPLLEAARRLALAPARCIYIGDDHRDMQAGRQAGMRALAAGWGYLGTGEAVEAWGADHILRAPHELLNWLQMA